MEKVNGDETEASYETASPNELHNSGDFQQLLLEREHCNFLIGTKSHVSIRLLDRTIGCDLANVRPIGNVCYDLQKRLHTTIGLFCWW